jgi:protease II
MVSYNTYSPNEIDKLWIAIANLGNDLTSHTVRYYACATRNASVTTNVTFSNNIQSLQATAIQEFDETIDGDDSSPTRAIENYQFFASILYNQLSGFVMRFATGTDILNRNWTMVIDQINLGTAKDFAAMPDAWKDEKLEDLAAVQEKNLITLFEEFSLNASMGLMSMPRNK